VQALDHDQIDRAFEQLWFAPILLCMSAILLSVE
jgi:hypothetical protein